MKRTVTLAALLLALTTSALARPGMHPQGHDRDGRSGRGHLSPAQIAEVLDLSEAQKDQAKALHESLQATVRPLREQMRTQREAVKAAVDAGNAQQAGQLLISNKATREQMKAAHEAFEAKFEAILTAEQKAKFSVLKDLRKARRERRG
jgi:Spy/CpxP family protein refolding chaperone